MSWADLAFLAAALTSVTCLIAAVVAIATGSRRPALRILVGWLIGVALYAAVTTTVKVRLPARILSVGDVECSDEWCLAVERVERTPSPDGVRYVVTLRLSSRALRRPQREKGLDVQIVSEDNHYDPAPDPTALPFDALLQPGEVVSTRRAFLIPTAARHPALAVIHRGFEMGFLIPGREPFEKTFFRLE